MSDYIKTVDCLPPDGEEVMCIDSGGHEQTLRRKGNLWWFPDGSMYVYFVPVAWKMRAKPEHGEG